MELVPLKSNKLQYTHNSTPPLLPQNRGLKLQIVERFQVRLTTLNSYNFSGHNPLNLYVK